MSPSNKLLVLNAGSSSLKFKLYQVAQGGALASLASGLCERVGDPSKSSMKVSKTLMAPQLPNLLPPPPTLTPF